MMAKQAYHHGGCVRHMSSVKSSLKNPSTKSRAVTSILALLFGWLGAHRFYIGKTRSALLMLILFIIGSTVVVGLSFWGINTFIPLTAISVWYLVDLVMTVSGNAKDLRGRPITNWWS